MCRFVAYYNFELIFGPHRPWRFMSIKITFQLLSLGWILQLNVKSVRHVTHKIRCMNWNINITMVLHFKYSYYSFIKIFLNDLIHSPLLGYNCPTPWGIIITNKVIDKWILWQLLWTISMKIIISFNLVSYKQEHTNMEEQNNWHVCTSYIMKWKYNLY